jgi:hypothetical protein
MTATRIFGLVGLSIGIVLLAFAYHASGAPLDRLSSALTGSYTDQTMWYVALGALGTLSGGLLLLFGKGA